MNLTLLCVVMILLTTVCSKKHPKRKTGAIKRKIGGKCECGRSYASEIETRIIEGYETAPHLYPWMVYLTYNDGNYCGGAVINDWYILTAAHCTADLTANEIKVVVGAHNITHNNKKFEVESITTHPELKSYEGHDDNDIALLKLKTQIKFSKKIVPICFPEEDDDFEGVHAIISGWGSIGNDETSDVLLESRVKVLSDKQCKSDEMIGDKYHIDENMCAYAPGTDTCQGDSGSPLVVESRKDNIYTLAGVVSWGYGCATPDVPGVYAKITHYMGWIIETATPGNFCN